MASKIRGPGGVYEIEPGGLPTVIEPIEHADALFEATLTKADAEYGPDGELLLTMDALSDTIERIDGVISL